MGHVVKISVDMSGFSKTPVDSVVLAETYIFPVICSHIYLVNRTSKTEIEEFCFLSMVN